MPVAATPTTVAPPGAPVGTTATTRLNGGTAYQTPVGTVVTLNQPPAAPLASSLGSNGEELSGRGSFSPDMPQGFNGEELSGRGSFSPDPVPTAPQSGPNNMTPAMQAYVNQFQKSQDAQQQALNAGLVQALNGLGQRRDAAAKVAATLPGEFNRAYVEATGNQQQQATTAANAFGHSTIGGNADEGLISSSNAAQRGAGLGAQPLLQAGIAADYSKGATALDNTHMQNQMTVDQQQQQFDESMLQNQMQRDATVADRTAGYAHDQAMAKLQSDLGLRNQLAQDAAAGKGQTQLDTAAVKAGFTDGTEYQNTLQSPDYQNALSTINGQASFGAKAGDVNGVIKTLLGHGAVGQNVLKALVAQGQIPASAWQKVQQSFQK